MLLRGLMDRKPKTPPHARLRLDEADHFCHRNAHYSPHSHSGLTTHLILNGSLTITYPREMNAEKVTYGVGDRIDVVREKYMKYGSGRKAVHMSLGNEKALVS